MTITPTLVQSAGAYLMKVATAPDSDPRMVMTADACIGVIAEAVKAFEQGQATSDTVNRLIVFCATLTDEIAAALQDGATASDVVNMLTALELQVSAAFSGEGE